MRSCLLVTCVLVSGCGSGSTTPAGAEDMAMPAGVDADLATSPCGPTGPFGTFTNVSGGQSGVTACGHMFSSFSGATITLSQGDAGAALLTVSGTGSIGDTTNCAATITGCNIAATGCPTGASSTISFTLMTFTHQLTGTAQPQIPGPGGGCAFTYSVDGSR
jgi:hypothetical protein